MAKTTSNAYERVAAHPSLRSKERGRVQHGGGGELRTKQAEKDATNANVIFRKYINDGVIPRPSGKEPLYGDFSDVGTYQEALARVQAAQDDFDALPAFVRDACDNDPAKLLEKAQTEEGLEELLALGMPEEATPDFAKPAKPEKTEETPPITGGEDSSMD